MNRGLTCSENLIMYKNHLLWASYYTKTSETAGRDLILVSFDWLINELTG